MKLTHLRILFRGQSNNLTCSLLVKVTRIIALCIHNARFPCHEWVKTGIPDEFVAQRAFFGYAMLVSMVPSVVAMVTKPVAMVTKTVAIMVTKAFA